MTEQPLLIGLFWTLVLVALGAQSYFRKWRAAKRENEALMASNLRQQQVRTTLELRMEKTEAELAAARGETTYWHDRTDALEEGILNIAEERV